MNKIDSSNLRLWEGHLTNTEKLSILIGWSEQRACSLILLKGGFEKGMLVLLVMKLLGNITCKSVCIHSYM